MSGEFGLLIVITVIFLLSLLGAVALFKFLKSTAMIKKAGYQAGGAVAGFLLIYGTLYGSFHSLCRDVWVWKPNRWTVSGTVKKSGTAMHGAVIVSHVPPRPSTVTDAGGTFRLENVLVMPNEGLPEIYLETDGFYPKSYQIDEKNALVDNEKKTIRLREPIELSKTE
ncbi:MAG: hypothetical protein V1736_11050 [Pseudomonadota bacterium]